MLPTIVLILSLSTYQSNEISMVPGFTDMSVCEAAARKWLAAHPENGGAIKATAVCVKVKD